MFYMNKVNNSNLIPGDDETNGQFDNELIPDDAWPVCLKCLKPCHPLQNYCPNCDTNEVINPLASYMPFERIRFMCGFYGKMWHIVWYDKEASIIFRLACLLLIFMFAPILLIVGFPLLLIRKTHEPKLQTALKVVLYIIVFIIFMVLLYFYLLQFLI
jgi:hypothetical protein